VTAETTMTTRRHIPSSQKGAALLVSLAVLLLMTILGVTAARTTTLQERMASNMRDKAIAFQAAEATLRFGEQWVKDQLRGERPIPVTLGACSSPPCDVYDNDSIKDPDKDATWDPAGKGAYMRDGPNLDLTHSRPRLYIEQQRFVPDALNVGGGKSKGRIYYRVTARSMGATDTGISVITSTFAARF